MDRLDRYTCDEALRRLDDFLDRELSPGEITMVQAHLDTCALCAAHFRFEAEVVASLKAMLKRIALPGDLFRRISRDLSRESDPHAADG